MDTTTSQAVDAGLNAVTGTFDGITSFMVAAPLFGVILAISLVKVGVSIFKRIKNRFARS